MTMAITILQNDYVKPSIVREEVVQNLVDFYLNALHTCWNEFCPNCCWRQHHSIGRRNGKLVIVGRTTQATYEITDKVKIRTCEMKEFFKIWLNAGYFISKGRYSVRNQTAIIYKFTSKPFTDYDYKLVTEFTEDID
jgi:hypothetical protein